MTEEEIAEMQAEHAEIKERNEFLEEKVEELTDSRDKLWRTIDHIADLSRGAL